MFDLSIFDSVQDTLSPEEAELAAGIMPPMKQCEEQNRPDALPALEGSADSRRTARLRYAYRKAFSEMSLLDAMKAPGFAFEKGYCYNFMTKGDIDALTYLKACIRQQRIKELIVSTWCVDMKDIEQLKKWVDEGRIGSLELYLGEIYSTGRHGYEVSSFTQIFEGYGNVRVVVARNHSKIMAGEGEQFTFIIQTSANINTNPRVENACIIIPEDQEAEEMLDFYRAFFHTITPPPFENEMNRSEDALRLLLEAVQTKLHILRTIESSSERKDPRIPRYEDLADELNEELLSF